VGGWTSGYTCLVVNTGRHLVVVDTGAGALAPSTGQLLKNLQAISIAPGDIDTVILTHGHPDHIGGVTDDRGQIIFRKARHFMWKAEWDFWTSSQAEATLDEHSRAVLVGVAQKNLLPVRMQLEVLSGEEEIVPGTKAMAASGNTPGQMVLEITSGDQTMLYVSDVVLHPVHLEQPEWHAAVDLIPGEIVTTRRRLLEKAASERLLVHAFHFPFPALGRVVTRGDAWKWEAVE